VLLGLRGFVVDFHTRRKPPVLDRRAGYDLRSIVLIGGSVSADNLAAGFGLGLYGVPILAAVVITAAATVCMSCAGFYLGSVLGGQLNRYADRISALAFAVIGAALIGHLI
jgi:putative Mn2+ efflux pump MntP